MNSIVISYGGSVLFSDVVNLEFLKELKNLLIEYCNKKKLYVVVGGGKTARAYIKQGRELNFDEKTLDQIGIEITRINARIFSNILQISNQEIPKTTDEAIKIDKKIVIMGGTTPGHSTDMVGAELAEKVNAEKFIIATNVDGVYDKDPNMYPNAHQIKELLIDDLIKQYGTKWESAGKNMVIDGPALGIIKKANILTYVLNGKKLNELKNALDDKKFNGTIIKK